MNKKTGNTQVLTPKTPCECGGSPYIVLHGIKRCMACFLSVKWLKRQIKKQFDQIRNQQIDHERMTLR